MTSSGDYVSVPATTLTFPPGTTSLPVAVTVNADNRHEPDETFNLNLSLASNATIVDATGTGTILDNTGRFFVSVADASVVQPLVGTTTLNIPVSLSATPVAGETVSVMVSTADGSAKVADGDYTAVPKTILTFDSATGRTRNVAVTVNSGPSLEPTESFTLDVFSPSTNAVISDGKAAAVIVSNKGQPVPSVYVSDARIIEPPTTTALARFHVFLTSPATAPVSVQYHTVDGTATAGSDYTSLPTTTLNFAVGESDKEVDVTVGADTFREPVQTFNLVLGGLSGVVAGDSSGTGSIVDPRGLFSVAVSNATVVESVNGTQLARFAVTLSATPAVGETVTVNVATADVTAKAANGDYTALLLSPLTFTHTSSPTVTVLVTVGAGPATDPTTTFNLNLSNPSANAALGDKQAIGTIVD